MDADEYQRQNQPSGGRGRPNVKAKEAEDWLREYLKDGAKPSGNRDNPEPGTVFADAAEAGFSKSTLWRAADALGVVKEKETFSKRWMWSLPAFGELETGEIEDTTGGYSEFDAFR